MTRYRACDTPPSSESEDETDSGSHEEQSDSGSASSDGGDVVLEADTIDATFSTS
jgi:hypothetical protein